MIRTVLDTSVLIRYLIRHSLAVTQVVEEYWVQGNIRVIIAPELVYEPLRPGPRRRSWPRCDW